MPNSALPAFVEKELPQIWHRTRSRIRSCAMVGRRSAGSSFEGAYQSFWELTKEIVREYFMRENNSKHTYYNINIGNFGPFVSVFVPMVQFVILRAGALH